MTQIPSFIEAKLSDVIGDSEHCNTHRGFPLGPKTANSSKANVKLELISRSAPDGAIKNCRRVRYFTHP